jgi:hypothetical protein
MRRGRRFLLLLAFALAPAFAREAVSAPGPLSMTVTPAFARFIASDAHRKTVLDTARRHNENLPDTCKAMDFAVSSTVVIYAPFRMDGAKPIEGAWAEPVTGTGCGKTLHFGVLTIVAPGESAVTLSLVPGESRADPMLQRDSVKDVLDHAAVAVGGCKELVVIDTRFDDWEGATPIKTNHGREARPWRETWIVWACSKHVAVTVHFTPNAEGTSVVVKSSEVKPVP